MKARVHMKTIEQANNFADDVLVEDIIELPHLTKSALKLLRNRVIELELLVHEVSGCQKDGESVLCGGCRLAIRRSGL